MNPCNITADLLPLYVEGTCSPGSREYVEEHIRTCPQCKALLTSMKQPVELNLPKQDSKKNFRRFSFFLVRRRVLVITLCVLLGLVVGGLIASKPVINYISETLPIPVEDIDAQVYLLSDGALYAELSYTGEKYEVVGSGLTASKDGVYSLKLWHTRLHDLIYEDNGTICGQYIQTEESDYVRHISDKPWADAVKIILTDGNQEIVLWEKGQTPPAADTEDEYFVWKMLESDAVYQKRK